MYDPNRDDPSTGFWLIMLAIVVVFVVLIVLGAEA